MKNFPGTLKWHHSIIPRCALLEVKIRINVSEIFDGYISFLNVFHSFRRLFYTFNCNGFEKIINNTSFSFRYSVKFVSKMPYFRIYGH